MFTTAHRELVTALVDLRKRAGLTQRELAEAVGREQNFVGRIETGQRRVDVVELITLCRACGAEPEAEIAKLVQMLADLIPARPAKRKS